MKRLKLPPLLAVIISLEMMLSPVAAHAQNLLQAVQMIGNAMTGGGGPNPQMQSNIDMIMQQTRGNEIDKQFNVANLSKIPGLMAYLGPNATKLNCFSLPAKPTTIKANVCTMGITQQPGMSVEPQVLEAASYAKAYDVLADRYDSFMVESTNASLPPNGISDSNENNGIGCMNNAMKMVDGYFAFRLNEITSTLTFVESAVADFKKQAKADREAVEDFTAVLDGDAAGSISEKVKARRPDLFEFGKQFGNECASMFAADFYNDQGQAGGFNGINKILKQTYQNPGNGAKYSPQSYGQASAAVESDISNMATKVAQQAKLNFSQMTDPQQGGLGRFLNGLKSNVGSATGSNSLLTSDLFADVQSKFNKQNEDLNSTAESIGSSLGGDVGEALRKLKGTNPAPFEAAVSSLKNQAMNRCLQNQINRAGSVEGIIKRINDRSKTGRDTNTKFKETVARILQNSETSIEQKLQDLQFAERQYPNRYKLEGTGIIVDTKDPTTNEIKKTKISAADIDTPHEYISVLVNTCKLDYSSTTQKNGMTMQQNIESLRNLRKTYESMAQNTATELEQTVRNKLLTCPGSTTGSTVGSCTQDVFNTNSSSTFCARTASMCAGKMRACTESTQNFITEKTNLRKQSMDKYNAKVDVLSQKIIGDVKQKIAKYLAESMALSQPPFNAGFVSPTGIEYEVPENAKYLGEFEQAKLKMQDPDKLVALLKNNLEKIKKAVGDQQKQLLGRGGLLADHIAQVKSNYQKAQGDLEKLASQCSEKVAQLKQYENEQMRKFAEEQQKKSQELGEKRNQMCSIYGAVRTNPGPGCDGITTEMMAADPVKYSEIKAYCNSQGHYGEESKKDVNHLLQAGSICAKTHAAGSELALRCAEFKKVKTAKAGDDNNCTETTELANNSTKLSVSEKCIERHATEVIVAAGGTNGSGTSNPDTSTSLEAPEAPAYCNAMDNSGRGYDPSQYGGGMFPQPVAGQARGI